MGRFIEKQGRNLLAKQQEALQSEGRNLLADSVEVPKNDNSIYARGGEWDLKKKFGKFGTGPKVMGLPVKELALTSGIPPAAIYEMITKEPAEDLLPMVGQIAGGALRTANPLLSGVASTVGATAGQAGRQGVKMIRGQEPQWGEVAKEPLITGTSELLFRGIPGLMFRKQIGGKARDISGRKIGEIASKVEKKAPFIRFSKNDIVQRIDKALQDIPFESGPQRTALVRIKNKLIAKNQPLTFSEMRQLEQQMGREASFAEEATSGKFARGPKAPKSNIALKTERARVSGKVDEAAKLAGFPEFEQESLKYANLMRKFPEKDLQKGGWVRNAATLALAGGGATAPMLGSRGEANPTLGAAMLLASLSPRMKTALFRKAIDTPLGRGVGRTATVGATEAARRLMALMGEE